MQVYSAGQYRDAIDRIAPFSLAEDWDNVGLLIGSPANRIGRALVALDATGGVIEQAMRMGANLIVTHHPVIFEPPKRIPGESILYRLIAAGIAVISAHTNWDIAPGGVNDVLAAMLELRNPAPLDCTLQKPYCKIAVFVPSADVDRVWQAMSQAGAGRLGRYRDAAFFSPGEGRFTPLEGAHPAVGQVGRSERVEEIRLEMVVPPEDVEAVVAAVLSAHPYEEPAYDILETRALCRREGLGRVGDAARPFEPEELALFAKQRLGAAGVRLSAGGGPITRIAVCGGSGADLLGKARAAGAQALITSEVKHHLLLEAAETGMTLIDAGHHATEAVSMPVLLERLREQLPGADIHLAESAADPALYL